jgi:hypothetical protein
MRNRKACEQYRREHGEEYFISTPAELREVLDEDAATEAGMEWITQADAHFLALKLPKWWKEFKPHINFLALKTHQQEWILRIDPDQANKLKVAASL